MSKVDYSVTQTMKGMVLSLVLVTVAVSGIVPLNAKMLSSACDDVCLCNGTFVNCSSQGLTTIPEGIPVSTIELDLSGNILGDLRNKLFIHLTKLQILRLKNASITHLASGVFDGLINLEFLDLSGNILSGLGDKLFMNLTNLQTLRLKKSSVTNLSSGVFDGLVNLEFLDISNNEPLSLTNETTPEDLFKPLSKLKYLKMYGNVGTYDNARNYIDVQLAPLVNLKTLWLDGFTENPFGKTYRNLTSLKSLQIIVGDGIEWWRRIEFCEIKYVQEDFFENLIYIQRLTIKGCSLKEIHPKAIEKLQSLQYLDFSKNQDLNFSHAFHSMCRLSKFKNSSLTTLKLNSLKHPEECGNRLSKSMAECIEHIPLKELYIEYNKLKSISYNGILSMPKSLNFVSVVGNDFETGFYMFQLFFFSNLTKLNASYQGYASEVSIWRRGKGHHHPNDESTEEVIDDEGGVEDDGDDVQPFLSNTHLFEMNEPSHGMLSFLETSDSVHYPQDNRGTMKRMYTHKVRDHHVCPQYNNGKYIPPGTITAFLPPLLTDIDVSRSRMARPIFEMYVDKDNSLKSIDASNSMLYCWDGPIHGLIKLEYLDLSYNFCSNVSMKIFYGLTNLRYLNIGYNFLGSSFSKDTEGQILAPLVNLTSLFMNYDRIYSLPRKTFKSLVNLESLNLRGNILETFDVEIEHMKKLRYLNLEFNRIKTLSENTRNIFAVIVSRPIGQYGKNGLCINLKFNTVHCFCSNIDFMQWAGKHYVRKCNKTSNALTVKLNQCFNEKEEIAHFDSDQQFNNVLHHLEDSCRSYTGLIVCLSVVLAIIVNIIIAVIVHRYRWRLQYWYFVILKGRTCRRKQQSREGYDEICGDSDFIYDVFVASCEDKNAFIIDDLRIQFKRHSLNAFLQAIDISATQPYVDITANKIHQSRVIVFILSDGWSKDYLMCAAYQMWRHDRGSRVVPKAIGVKLGNLPANDLGKIDDGDINVLLDHPGDENEHDQDTFWTTLVQTIKEQGTEVSNANTVD